MKRVKVKKSAASAWATEARAHDPSTYRRLALALPDVIESSHMGAPDFRITVGSKQRIFATLAYGAKGLGTLMIDVEQQAAFLADAPEYFEAVPGGWGRMGMTLVKIDAPEKVLEGALATAYHGVMGKMLKSVRKKAGAKTRSRE